MSACPNASRSGHVRYQMDSEAEAPPSRVVGSHGRNGSGSSIGSASSTASFFTPSPHHRHTNSDSSLSSISSGVLSPAKRRTAQLPTAAPASVIHTEADEWAMRPNDEPRPTQIAEELNKFTIHVDLTEADIRAMLRGGPDQTATVPSTNVMRIAIVGLPRYICEVRPRGRRILLSRDDVVFPLVTFLRTEVTKREAHVHKERYNATDVAEGSRRCDLLPQGERTRLEGFTLLDEGENLWRLG